MQDVRLVRRAGALVDRTQLKNPDVKLNWQATKKDMVSFLYFDGFKIKDGRSPGIAGILFDAPTATFHQDNAYTDNPLHGLWKIADDRVITSNMFLSAKYAYYNTGFILDPVGGLDQQAGRNFTTATVVRLGQPEPQRAPAEDRQRRPEQLPQRDGRQPRSSSTASASGRWMRSAARCGRATGSSRSRTRRPTCARRCSARASAATAPTISTSTSATRFQREASDRGSRRPLRPAGGQGAGQRRLPPNPAFPNVVPGFIVRRLRLAVHLEELLAARRRDLRARRVAEDGRAGELQPLRRPARDRHGRRH